MFWRLKVLNIRWRRWLGNGTHKFVSRSPTHGCKRKASSDRNASPLWGILVKIRTAILPEPFLHYIVQLSNANQRAVQNSRLDTSVETPVRRWGTAARKIFFIDFPAQCCNVLWSNPFKMWKKEAIFFGADAGVRRNRVMFRYFCAQRCTKNQTSAKLHQLATGGKPPSRNCSMSRFSATRRHV